LLVRQLIPKLRVKNLVRYTIYFRVARMRMRRNLFIYLFIYFWRKRYSVNFINRLITVCDQKVTVKRLHISNKKNLQIKSYAGAYRTFQKLTIEPCFHFLMYFTRCLNYILGLVLKDTSAYFPPYYKKSLSLQFVAKICHNFLLLGDLGL
jgi:hypothetical protein